MATYPPPAPHSSPPCGKWWPARHSRPFFLPPLCCRSRQSKIRLVGQTGATYTSQRTVTHLEHSGKDFNTPNPSQTPPSLPSPPPPTPFLITHYPVPVSGRECRMYLQAARPELMEEGKVSGRVAAPTLFQQIRPVSVRVKMKTQKESDRPPLTLHFQ